MPKVKKPEAYKTPLRKRADIIAWIVDNTDQRFYDHEKCPFCFNVKVYSVDLEFDHLLKIYREEQDGNEADDWLPEARQRWEKHKEVDLFNWALEDCRDGVSDSDVYNQLWDGTPVNATYTFRGRNGGWLSLDKFLGWTFASRDSDFPEALAEMDYKELRQLYQLIAMLKHDLRRAAIEKEVEYKAAWALFVNVCSDLTDKVYPQMKFPFMTEPEAVTA